MHITIFESVSRAYVKESFDLDWTDIVKLLTTHTPARRKEDVMMFNMAEFKAADAEFVERGRRYHGSVVDGVYMRDANGTYDEIANSVRRCKGNVVGITGIVLDVDEAMTIEQAHEMLEPLEFVLYTTFRHSPEKNKFRIVIPFKRALLAADIAGRQASISGTFPGVDNASFTVSQSFYFHSGNKDPIAYHNPGIMLDPYDDFAYQEPKIYSVPSPSDPVRQPLDSEHAVAYKQAVIKSLLTCSGMHYAGTNGSSHAVLTLVSLCRSIGCSYEEFDEICYKISAPDSQLRNPATRRAAWTGWAGDRIRRENRDEFIRAYNGTPVQIERTRVELPTTGNQAAKIYMQQQKKYKNLL
jgi:hypothetical protein